MLPGIRESFVKGKFCHLGGGLAILKEREYHQKREGMCMANVSGRGSSFFLYVILSQR